MSEDKTYLVYKMDFLNPENNSLFYDDNAVEEYDLISKDEPGLDFPFYYTVNVDEGGEHSDFIMAFEIPASIKNNKDTSNMYYVHFKQRSILPVHISKSLAEAAIRNLKHIIPFNNNKTNCPAWFTRDRNSAIVGIPLTPKDTTRMYISKMI